MNKCQTCEYWSDSVGCLLDDSKTCDDDNSYFHYTPIDGLPGEGK